MESCKIEVKRVGTVRLTELCHCSGCAAKIRAKDIEDVLKKLPLPFDKRVLAGHQSADDAVVIKVREDLALVQTVDFFPPIVDNPRLYGRIAAANSLSDVYAMGGTPLSAMNITCFPTKKYGTELLSEILQGGLEKVLEAGAVLAGGHTVEDSEPKFGLAVTGTIDPNRIVSKGGAKPGDKLILTKSIGTGVLSTAMRCEDIESEELKNLITSMETLNKEASQAMVQVGVTGGTDITGYSLLGHSLEMCRAAGIDMELRSKDIPLLPGAIRAYKNGYYPNGSFANRKYVEPFIEISEGVNPDIVDIMADAQTSGGLLISVSPKKYEQLCEELSKRGVIGYDIGVCLASKGKGQFIHII